MATEKQKAEKIDFIIGKYIRIEPIFHERRFVFDNKLVFVLMPFSEPWSDRIWEKLKEIIESKGLRAERADNRYGAIITEDIWTGIMESRLIVCDTSGWNPNVFYELGIAHAVGKHVILLTQPTHHLPFDTQGLRHLIYTDNPNGMRKLEEELPQWIDYCLSKKVPIGRISIKKPKIKKSEIKKAWEVNTKGYDPELPPMKYQLLRSKFGVLRGRMKTYAYAFSEGEIEQFVKEIREIWPEKWTRVRQKTIEKKYEELEEVVNKWRGGYREKVK